MKIRLRYVLLVCACAVVAYPFYREGVASQDYGFKENFNNSFSGHYLAGYVAAQEGKWKEGAALLEAAHKQEPKNNTLAESVYTLRLLSGDTSGAIKIAKAFSGKGEDAIISHILLAMDAIRSDNYKTAEKQLYSVSLPEVGKAPAVGSVIVPFLAAWAKAGEGEYNDALNLLKAVETSATYEVVEYHKALIYDMMGNVEEAKKAYEASLSGKIKPYHFIEAAGGFYARHGMMDKAKELYRSYQDLNPTTEFFENELASLDKGVIPQSIKITAKQGFIESLMEAVRIAYQNNLYTEGMAYLQMINYLAPDFPQSLILLANHYEEQGNFLEANRLYSRIEKDSSFYWKSQINIARNLYLSGNKTQGEKMLRQLADQKPSSYVAPLELADLLREDEHFDSAAAAYEQVVARIGKPTQFHWFVYYTLGISYEQAGQWDKAEKALRAALELSPGQPDILNYLGYSWLVKGKNIPEAKKMIEEAMDARPDDAHIVDSMGWALFQIGEYDKAVEYLEQAVETMPYDPVMNEHLGDVYWRVGRQTEARFQWQRAMTDHDAEPKQVKGLKEKLAYGLNGKQLSEQKVSTSQF